MRIRAVALLLLIACSTADPWFRRAEPRAATTIFSPLALPTPTAQRTASGAPGPEYWQQQADYVIEAALDPETREITATARVTYTNNSPDTLDYLWLHLEQNSFRQDSLSSAVSQRTAEGGRRGEGEGYAIRHVRSVEGADLKFTVHDLVARLDLPDALPPHGTFVFDIGWSFTVPENVFRRFGIEKVEQGVIFELAQWFPCVAVYDDVHGWNTLPYAGQGEFYTNFGDFDVKLTVPRDHLVVATGELQNPEEVLTATQRERYEQARQSTETVLIRAAEEVGQPDSRPAGEGPLTWHFKAGRVRTFAFATSAAFILDAASLDGTPAGTLLQSAYPKEALPLWEKSTQMLRVAMAGYNDRWFPYPWPVMTNVSGREGGMEYPMIIFCGGRRDERALYGVTTHELGHEWFPMTVNTDERRHAWMDEGFNTFINYYSAWDWFDEPEHDERNRSGRSNPARYAASMLGADLLPIDTPPDRMPRRLISTLEYTKTGAGLVLLREQILGPERFDFAFRTYIRRWAFKSPRPADFYRSMEDAAGADLSWFWRGWFQENGTLDQAVAQVVQPEPTGRDEEGVWRHLPARVTVENRGELVMPLALKVTFADGGERSVRLPVEIWATTDRWTEPFASDVDIESVVIDPDEAFPDVARGNNAWKKLR